MLLGKYREINTIYFLFIFAFLLFIYLFHFFIEPSSFSLFFFLQTFLQSAFEASFLYFLALFLHSLKSTVGLFLYISLTFIILLAHLADFTISRLLDASFSYVYKLLFCSNFLHFIIAFDALNLAPSSIALYILLCFFIPFLGISLYFITLPLSQKIPTLSKKNTFSFLFLLLLGSFFLDLAIGSNYNLETYRKFQKTLPFGRTFTIPSSTKIDLPQPIAKCRNEEKILSQLQVDLPCPKKPNIYLFIIESLRKDFITQEIAPELTHFAEKNISFLESYANANATHLSWFSIFHGNLPLIWTQVRDQWNNGSPALQILKKLGYKTHVYTSADLRFFEMDTIIFGKERNLADQIYEFHDPKSCTRDQKVFDLFFKNIEQASSQHFFVFFLDSTHSEYSVPDSFSTKFPQTDASIDYLTLSPQKLEPLKNRYRNAIGFIDSLFHQFTQKLKEKGLYEEAIILVTGDHGEEFYEDKSLFHGTHLNSYQTSVPIFYKLGNSVKKTNKTFSTHIDLFPSIFHHLTNKEDWKEFFDGISIFAKSPAPYPITVMQNGALPPEEFAICQNPRFSHFRILSPMSLECVHSTIEKNDFNELLNRN